MSAIVFVVICYLLVGTLCRCPPTQQEKSVAETVSMRRKRYDEGQIEREINEKSYTAETLTEDMLDLWVNSGLLAQGDSIAEFSSIMSKADQQSQSQALLAVLLGWVSDIMAASQLPGFEMIVEATGVIRSAALEWSGSAKAAVLENSNYFDALDMFSKSVPTDKVTSYKIVDDFVDVIKANNETFLLLGYSFVTELAVRMPSYRRNFNAYVSNFLTATFPDRPSEGDYRNSMLLILDDPDTDPSSIFFPVTPSSVDGCKLIEEVWKANDNCLGSGDIAFKWLESTYSPEIAADAVYNCASMKKPLICCGIYCEECDNPPGLPTQHMRNQCSKGLTQTNKVFSQTYGVGPEQCQ